MSDDECLENLESILGHLWLWKEQLKGLDRHACLEDMNQLKKIIEHKNNSLQTK